jgi:hypothetical protein
MLGRVPPPMKVVFSQPHLRMPTPPPSLSTDWLSEVLDHLEVAAMAAVGEGLEDEPDRQAWVNFMQRHAISSCRQARGLDESLGPPESELDELEAIDDLAHALRNSLPGEAREVVSEAQLYLLFYLAAHIRTGVLPSDEGQAVARACWQECGGDCGDDEPLSIGMEPPSDPCAWVDELIDAYASSNGINILCLGDGTTFTADSDCQLETAIVRALANRQAAPGRAALEELIATITAMEADVSGMGPEWHAMRRIPALGFAMYYVWVHLALGLTDEDTAMAVMRDCTTRIGEFNDG